MTRACVGCGKSRKRYGAYEIPIPACDVTTPALLKRMYNKLFSKILDSSIWLESDTTRIVWFTLLAAMDQDGFAQFASVPNLAHRARVSVEAAEKAVKTLESADPNSSDPDNEGKRIERVPGGWMVLNCQKYQELVTRAISREQTRIRVARHREKKGCNAHVTVEKRGVTQSDAEAEAEKHTQRADGFEKFWQLYPKKRNKLSASRAWLDFNCQPIAEKIMATLRLALDSKEWNEDGGRWIPNPEKWISSGAWENQYTPVAVSGKVRSATEVYGNGA